MSIIFVYILADLFFRISNSCVVHYIYIPFLTKQMDYSYFCMLLISLVMNSKENTTFLEHLWLYITVACYVLRSLTMAGDRLAWSGLGNDISAPDWLNRRLFNSTPLCRSPAANISSFANLLQKRELIYKTDTQ